MVAAHWYRRVPVMLKREGFKDKQVYRLYKEQGRLVSAPEAAKAKQGDPIASAQNNGAQHQSDLEHGLRSRQPV